MRYRRTTLITALCLSILAGLGLSRKVDLPLELWLSAVPALGLLAFKARKLRLLLIIVIGLGIGMWRGGAYMANVRDLQALAERRVTIVATAASDSIYNNKSQIQFIGHNVRLLEPYQKPLAGSFKLRGFGEQMIYRGDTVVVAGKLYPSRGSTQATIAYAQLTRLSPGHSWYSDLSRRFSAGMQSALPEPLASFAMGLLVGQRTSLPASLTAALTTVGLVHIVAVSGYNLTIIVRAVGRLKLGSKYQKLTAALLLIAGFVMVTGLSASIVRAALVSVLSLWAWYYGRRVKPVVLISIAAVATALWNPFYIWSDLGWHLSFLAFFGVLVIAPALAGRFLKKEPRLLTMVLLETLSAELMTLPLILMTFSQLSIIALIANLLVVPLVPLAMLLSAVAGLAGMAAPQIAGWLALPARLLLTYMLDIVHMLSSVPSALVHRSISLPAMLVVYVAVMLALIASRHKIKKPAKRRRGGTELYLTP